MKQLKSHISFPHNIAHLRYQRIWRGIYALIIIIHLSFLKWYIPIGINNGKLAVKGVESCLEPRKGSVNGRHSCYGGSLGAGSGLKDGRQSWHWKPWVAHEPVIGVSLTQCRAKISEADSPPAALRLKSSDNAQENAPEAILVYQRRLASILKDVIWNPPRLPPHLRLSLGSSALGASTPPHP